MATKFYATESDFFQVVRETKTTVTVRPVKSEIVEVTDVRTSFDFDTVRRAIADSFTTSWLFSDAQNTNGKRCRRGTWGNDEICINADYRVYAYPCNGSLGEFTTDYR